MSPQIARRYLGLYLLAWTPLALLLTYLLVLMGGLRWTESASLSFPLALLFALLCLAPRSMCLVLPLGSTSTLKILEYHTAAAAVAALIWIVAAKGLAIAIGHYAF
ncbi:MAG TPA: hypothetical protein VFW44_01580, partial [Bryobacteraceae bacterium]|nr:hypothetical protein [Bryobacteraceae bacterium]